MPEVVMPPHLRAAVAMGGASNGMAQLRSGLTQLVPGPYFATFRSVNKTYRESVKCTAKINLSVQLEVGEAEVTARLVIGGVEQNVIGRGYKSGFAGPTLFIPCSFDVPPNETWEIHTTHGTCAIVADEVWISLTPKGGPGPLGEVV